MNEKEKILKIIKDKKPELEKKFGVSDIAIFGSFIRNEQNTDSDIDILVSLKQGYKTFDNFMDLKFFLENVLSGSVDLMLKESIRHEFKDGIYKEAVYV